MSLRDRLQKVEIEEPVHVAGQTVMVKLPAWKDPVDGEIYIDELGQQILDSVRQTILEKQ